MTPLVLLSRPPRAGLQKFPESSRDTKRPGADRARNAHGVIGLANHRLPRGAGASRIPGLRNCGVPRDDSRTLMERTAADSNRGNNAIRAPARSRLGYPVHPYPPLIRRRDPRRASELPLQQRLWAWLTQRRPVAPVPTTEPGTTPSTDPRRRTAGQHIEIDALA